MKTPEKTPSWVRVLADVPPLPPAIFDGVEAHVHHRRFRLRIAYALAALLAIAVIMPISLVDSVHPAARAAVTVLPTDSTDSIDAILDDAGSLFHEDVSSDEEFLAIAYDSYTTN